MKKRITETAVVAVILLMLTIHIIYYSTLPSFQIYNSFVLMTNEGRETEINVIIYKDKNEEVYKAIEQEHNRVNGIPKTLKINLFNADKEIKKGIAPYSVIFIDYTENIYEILHN